MRKITLTLLLAVLLAPMVSTGSDKEASEPAKKKAQFRKTQEVSFDETDIDGQVRAPDGAYLLQKRGVRFLPLYKVNHHFEKHILESIEYLR